MTMKKAGYVYILTNSSFKDDIVKMGKTACGHSFQKLANP